MFKGKNLIYLRDNFQNGMSSTRNERSTSGGSE